LGIEQMDHKELILHGLNDFLPSFTVQYERVTLQLSRELTSIQTLNGSRSEVNQPGTYKIILP